MLPPFDIFRLDPEGAVHWLAAEASLRKARMRIRMLMEASPGEYVILSHETGNRIVINDEQSEIKRKVFQIAYDEQLLQSRAALLENHGHEVTSVLGNDDAKAAL